MAVCKEYEQLYLKAVKELAIEELLKQVRYLNGTKYTGYDKIPPNLLKTGTESAGVFAYFF